MNEAHCSRHFTESEYIDMAVIREEIINPDFLYNAVKRNDLTCVKELLSKGARPDISDNKEITALHWAVLAGNADMVWLILKASQHPPDIDTYRDHNNQTTREMMQKRQLFKLNLSGGIQILTYNNLIFYKRKENNKQYFPLISKYYQLTDYSSSQKYNREANWDVKNDILIQLSGYPIYLNDNRRLEFTEYGQFMVYKTCDYTISQRVKKLASLLEQPVVKEKGFEEALNIALHVAVSKDNLICAFMLLCKGANASNPYVHNMTALHLAAWNGNIDMVRLILTASQKPPDIDSYKDYNNRTTRDVIQNLWALKSYNMSEELKVLSYYNFIFSKEKENMRFVPTISKYYQLADHSSSNGKHNLDNDDDWNINHDNLIQLSGYPIRYPDNYGKEFIKYKHENSTTGERMNELASLLEQPVLNPNFQEALNIALHIAVSKDNMIYAYMLLCKGANASDPNIHNMTALHLAAYNGHIDTVFMILTTSQQLQDIDSYKDYNDRTTREIIENLLKFHSFNSNFFKNLQIPAINLQTLEFFLNNSDDEAKCLKVMRDGIQDELSHLNTRKATEKLLNIATQRNYCIIVQEILQKLDPICLDLMKTITVLYGNHAVLREILKLHPEVTNDLIMDACKQLRKPPRDNTCDRLESLKLILKQENVNIRFTDDEGNTPLYYALEGRPCYEAATLLLKRGSYLGHVNKCNKIVIANVPAFVLSSYFNDCIELKKEWTDECTIDFDYRCLMPHKEQYKTSSMIREMDAILYIATNDTFKHLLKHPLISSFLHIKWNMIRHALYANFVFYMVFYIFLNIYILSMIYTCSSENNKQIFDSTILEIVLQNNKFFWIFGIVMFLLFTIREVLQFVFDSRYYITDVENWLQILLVFFTFSLLTFNLCDVEFKIEVIFILLSTWKLMCLISHHLFPSTCIEMFYTVCFNFVRLLFPYLFLICAFALVFYMLLVNDKRFSDPGLSLFKTMIMFTGEFDANNISFSAYPIFSRVVFALFVFYIVIVLLNLLNGLAIHNIAEILDKAEIIGTVSRVRLIAYFERMIIGEPFRKNSLWWQWNLFHFLPSGMFMFPYYFRNGKFLFPYYFRNGKMTLKPYDNVIVYDRDVDDISVDDDKRWPTLKMDPNIIKCAKQIVYDKNKPSNDDIMNELTELQKRLTQTNIRLQSKRFNVT